MMRQRSLEVVAGLVRAQGAGQGLTVPALRARYPAKSVRRTAIVEAVRFLEDTGAVARHGDRVRWIGPIPDDARPLGLKWRRVARDLALSPQERVAASIALSEALLPRKAADGR